MQQVYCDYCKRRANVFRMHKRFFELRERLEGDNREGRPILAMAITFFDSKGIIHREFVPTGQKITGPYCVKVLERLMARIRRIRPEYRDPETWFLLHDNVPIHTSLTVRQFSARLQVCFLNHLPNSPDLAPCDFSLFPKWKLKRFLIFNDISTIKAATTRTVEEIPRNELKHIFESLLCKVLSVFMKRVNLD